MFHEIEFRLKGIAQRDSSDANVNQGAIARGTRVRAEIRPYVVETKYGPVEVADLSLEDGTVARGVRFASFRFVEK
jgi:hypothetical protein